MRDIAPIRIVKESLNTILDLHRRGPNKHLAGNIVRETLKGNYTHHVTRLRTHVIRRLFILRVLGGVKLTDFSADRALCVSVKGTRTSNRELSRGGHAEVLPDLNEIILVDRPRILTR